MPRGSLFREEDRYAKQTRPAAARAAKTRISSRIPAATNACRAATARPSGRWDPGEDATGGERRIVTTVIPTAAERSEAEWKDLFCWYVDQMVSTTPPFRRLRSG